MVRAPWHRRDLLQPDAVGLLTESFTAVRVASLPADDWRRRSREFQGAQLTRNLALCDAPCPIAERYGTTVSAVAIAWVLAWPSVSVAIVGARTPAQVDGWVAAASLELTPLDLDEIDGLIERTGAGAGPAHPAVPRAIAR